MSPPSGGCGAASRDAAIPVPQLVPSSPRNTHYHNNTPGAISSYGVAPERWREEVSPLRRETEAGWISLTLYQCQETLRHLESHNVESAYWEYAGVPEELYVAVHIEHIGATGYVVEGEDSNGIRCKRRI